jgi:DNA-directed RNA polymerase subunit RPC12/RpoP
MGQAQVIRLVCPNLTCRVVLSVPSSARGKTVQCKHCGSRLAVPGQAAKAG